MTVHIELKVYYCAHRNEGILLYTLNWRIITVHSGLKVCYCTHLTEGILLYTLNWRYITVHIELKVYYCTHGTVGILLYSLNLRHVTVHTEPEAYYVLSELYGISKAVDVLLCSQVLALNRAAERRESLRLITFKIHQRVAGLRLIKLWTSGFLHLPCS
jgi:S-adenosylmethionine/arginine decarboxylase-like enzyme